VRDRRGYLRALNTVDNRFTWGRLVTGLLMSTATINLIRPPSFHEPVWVRVLLLCVAIMASFYDFAYALWRSEDPDAPPSLPAQRPHRELAEMRWWQR
jgi:hypothetical protein